MTATRRPVVAPLQQALYERLSADSTLAELVKGVYDHVPETATLPYVVVGDAIETPDNTLDNFGASTICLIHVWSDYRGFTEGNTIAGRISELLDRQPLTVPGHTVIVVRFQQTQPVRDPNPQLRHVLVRFQVLTEQE